MRRPSETKKSDVLKMFVNMVVDQKNEGRSLVFVDEKLLEWVDEQVESGKYRNRSRAIEYAVAALKEERESRRGLEVLGSSLTKFAPQTNDSPGETRDRFNIQMEKSFHDLTERLKADVLTCKANSSTVRRLLTEFDFEVCKIELRKRLHEKYGNDMTAWLEALQRLSKHSDLTEVEVETIKALRKEVEGALKR